MCFLSCLHIISFRGPRNFKLGFRKVAAIAGHCPQAWQRRPAPGIGAARRGRRAHRYGVDALPALPSAPKLHTSLLCQVQYSFLSSFFPPPYSTSRGPNYFYKYLF